MSNLDRLHELKDQVSELRGLGLVSGYTERDLNVLIGNELILANYPWTKYECRIERLAKKYFLSEKRVESILQKRKTVLKEGE